MGSGTPTYLGDTIITQYDCPKFDSDVSNRRIIEREAANHGISLRGVHIDDNSDDTETIRIGIEDARNNVQAVAAFQRAVSLVFRFDGFQQRAVEQSRPCTATNSRAIADHSASQN